MYFSSLCSIRRRGPKTCDGRSRGLRADAFCFVGRHSRGSGGSLFRKSSVRRTAPSGLEKESAYDLVLVDEHVNASANDTFDKSGIAKNSREEKIRARDAKIKQDAENAKMAKLYRKEVLGEQEQPGFISLGEIKPAAPVVKAEVEETVSGD